MKVLSSQNTTDINQAKNIIGKYLPLITEPGFNHCNNSDIDYDSLDFVDIEFFDEDFVLEINAELEKSVKNTSYRRSEMTYKERAFLNGIIRKTKPKNIVEIGVSAGGNLV